MVGVGGELLNPSPSPQKNCLPKNSFFGGATGWRGAYKKFGVRVEERGVYIKDFLTLLLH
jgi:hypothetical protein